MRSQPNVYSKRYSALSNPIPKLYEFRSGRGRPIPDRIKKAIRDRSGGHCEVQLPGCTGTAQDFGHIKPKSHGGSHEEHNICATCRACHIKVEAGLPGTEGFRTGSNQREGISKLGKVVMLKRMDGTEFAARTEWLRSGNEKMYSLSI